MKIKLGADITNGCIQVRFKPTKGKRQCYTIDSRFFFFFYLYSIQQMVQENKAPTTLGRPGLSHPKTSKWLKEKKKKRKEKKGLLCMRSYKRVYIFLNQLQHIYNIYVQAHSKRLSRTHNG